MFFTTPNKNATAILNAGANEIDTPKQGSDRLILICVITLMVFGVLAIYSAIATFAKTNDTTAINLVTNHLIKLGISFSILLLFSKIDYHTVAKFSRIALLLSWVSLIIVMIAGHEVFGARRSLEIGIVSFQPSTLASVSLLIHVSVLLANKQEYIKDFKRAFLPILFWVVITCGLIGVEDFGGAAVLMLLCLLLMFIGRVSVIQIGSLILIGVIGSIILLASSTERQNRLNEYISQVTHLNTQDFNLGEGYQAQQADIAIARGKVFGAGMGQSTQRDFLPASYNDFIFAIIGEEYGLVGSVALIFIFLVILFRGITSTAKNAPDILGTLMGVVCTFMIVLYGFINAGVACGLLPVTGLPMPFVSYGGTNMLFSGLMIGILLNISKHSTKKRTVFYA